MYNKLFFLAILSFTFLAISCDDDDSSNESETIDYKYHAHILSPNTDNKHVGDSIHIHVDFESHAGEAVHHVKVRIFNAADSTVIYDQPESAHVHEMDGLYEFHDDFVLSEFIGVTGHSNWVLEAKVWGHEAGEGEEIETVEFHVHP